MNTNESAQDNPDGQDALGGGARSNNTTQHPGGIRPGMDEPPQSSHLEATEGHIQRWGSQSHLPPHLQQLATPPVRPAPAPVNASVNDEAIGGAIAQEEQPLKTMQPQPSPGSRGKHSNPATNANAQQTAQIQAPPLYPQQLQPQPQQPHPQHQSDLAQAQVQARVHTQQPGQPEAGQQRQAHAHQQALVEDPLGERSPGDHHRQQQHVQQQPWPGQHDMQIHHEMSKQQQQPHQQQKTETPDRHDAERWRISLLTGYVPPVSNAQVNVPVLLQQTSAAIIRWGNLQKSLDVRSESATANLAAQAQARTSLKRDLTNLTQLADAQTKHTQRAKMRQIHAKQVTKAPAQGGFSGGAASAAPPLMSGANSAGPGGVTRGVTPGDSYTFPHNQPAINPPGASPAMALRANPTMNTHTTIGSMGVVLAQQGGGGPGAPHGSLKAARPDYNEDVQTAGRPSEWPSSSATTSSSQPSALSASPSPPLPQQHDLPLPHRLLDVKQRLDRTEPRNKWVVLVDAALRLLPDEGSTYKQFMVTILGFLNSYNGTVGAEVAQALRSCLDPRVFDPMDIKRSQERMMDVYSRWARRGQRR